jgi:tetratricopeptide (TPR) repeat protein
LAPILTENPHNAPALYLQGISYFDLEQLANSRKSLEAANAVAPRNGPVLNNLAVVLYRQKQFPSALGYYDQALLAMPANTQILDNVIEAMNSLPDADRQAVIAQRLAKLAADQDATAQKTMAAKGLHRWGSTWIDQSQSDQIQAAQQTIGRQVSNLQTQISALDQQLVSMRTTVDQNTILMQQIQASSIARDPNTGNVIFLAYPPEYYTMLNTNSNLYGAIQSGQSREANLNQEITKVQQQPLPVPKFTGVQHMMGPDELTTFLPPGTATQPAANTPAIKGDSSLSPEPQTPAAPSPAPKPPGPGDVPIPAPALPGHFVPPDLPSSMVFPTVPAFSSAAAG